MYLEKLKITVIELASLMKVPPSKLYSLTSGKRSMGVDIAAKLALVFGNDPRYWINLQTEYDLDNYYKKEGKQDRYKVKVYKSDKT